MSLHNITSQQVWESTWIITEISLSSKLVFIALNPWALWVIKPVHVYLQLMFQSCPACFWLRIPTWWRPWHKQALLYPRGEMMTNKRKFMQSRQDWMLKNSSEFLKYSKCLKTRAQLSELRPFTVIFLFSVNYSHSGEKIIKRIFLNKCVNIN